MLWTSTLDENDVCGDSFLGHFRFGVLEKDRLVFLSEDSKVKGEVLTGSTYCRTASGQIYGNEVTGSGQ